MVWCLIIGKKGDVYGFIGVIVFGSLQFLLYVNGYFKIFFVWFYVQFFDFVIGEVRIKDLIIEKWMYIQFVDGSQIVVVFFGINGVECQICQYC